MNKNEVIEVRVEELNPFNEDIFRLYEGSRLDEMVTSIKNSGVINPIIVRETADGLQILAGHNRVNAAMIAGLKVVPAYNKGEVTDHVARWIVTETNLMQRGFKELSLLEKAACISVRHMAMKHQGIQPELIAEIESLSADESHTRVKLGKAFEMSGRNISRYVKIHELTDEMKTVIEAGFVGFAAAVHLSYLTREHQWMVAGIITELGCKVNEEESISLQKLEEGDYLTEDAVYSVLGTEPGIMKRGVRLSGDLLVRFFKSGDDREHVREVVEKALEAWFERT